MMQNSARLELYVLTSEHREWPSSSSCHKVEELPQKPSSARVQLHLSLSCGGSYCNKVNNHVLVRTQIKCSSISKFWKSKRETKFKIPGDIHGLWRWPNRLIPERKKIAMHFIPSKIFILSLNCIKRFPDENALSFPNQKAGNSTWVGMFSWK